MTISNVITVKKINAYSITFKDGSTMEFQQDDEDWNSMRVLRNKDGLRMIVVRRDAPNLLMDLFNGIFRMEDHEWVVIMASPQLIEKMKGAA